VYRKITDGFYWLQECPTNNTEFVDQVNPPKWYKGNEEVHIPQSIYLLVDEYSLLFDTFSPASTDEVLDEVKEILGERDLDYLVLSHTDVPHAGNTKAILDTYPGAQLIAPKYGTGHELYRLNSSKLVGNGDKLELGKFKIKFHEAPFVDSAIHLWMTRKQQIHYLLLIGMDSRTTEVIACCSPMSLITLFLKINLCNFMAG